MKLSKDELQILNWAARQACALSSGQPGQTTSCIWPAKDWSGWGWLRIFSIVLNNGRLRTPGVNHSRALLENAMSEHCRTPWIVRAQVMVGKHRAGFYLAPDETCSAPAWASNRANADFIVEAVNNHGRLKKEVEELKHDIIWNTLPEAASEIERLQHALKRIIELNPLSGRFECVQTQIAREALTLPQNGEKP